MTATASTATIRSWAIAEGLDVSERGRLKPDVLKAYADAHASAAKPKVATAKPAKAPAKKASKPPVRAAAKTAPKPAAAEKVTAAPADQKPVEDTRMADLEAAVSALTARVAKLEAAPVATKKKFGRKG